MILRYERSTGDARHRRHGVGVAAGVRRIEAVVQQHIPLQARWRQGAVLGIGCGAGKCDRVTDVVPRKISRRADRRDGRGIAGLDRDRALRGEKKRIGNGEPRRAIAVGRVLMRRIRRR